MTRRTLRAALLASVFGLAGCVAAPVEAPVEATIEPPAETTSPTTAAAAPPPAPSVPSQPSFSTAMERHKPLGLVPGADTPRALGAPEPNADFSAAAAYAEEMESYAFLVWQGGALRHAQYFAPFDETLRPESASMHKSVLSLVVGAAVDEGAIGSLDDPVGVYLTEWADDPRGDITLRQMLQMTSGLASLSFAGGMNSEYVRYTTGRADARATILGLETVAPPGEIFQYMNTVSQLVGLIVERATGQPYADYLDAKIWAPIGADDAYVWYFEPDGFPRTASALLAKAEDWLKVGLLIKDDGVVGGEQIVSSAYLGEMTAPSPANPNYGFQTWLGTEFDPDRYYNDAEAGFAVIAGEPFAVDDLVYFDGFGGQRVYISRSLDLVIVRTGESRLDWDDAKLPNLVIAAINAE